MTTDTLLGGAPGNSGNQNVLPTVRVQDGSALMEFGFDAEGLPPDGEHTVVEVENSSITFEDGTVCSMPFVDDDYGEWTEVM